MSKHWKEESKMKKLVFVTLLAAVVATIGLVVVQTETASANKPLTGTIDYSFVGHLGELDGEGRLLVWEATISGDIEGVMLWWFVGGGGPPNMPHPDAPHVSFYEARWEIFDSAGNLVLAGDSSGVTARPRGKDGIWNGHGKVTEASGEFENWIGRHVSEGGNVNWDFPFSGSGIFRIN